MPAHTRIYADPGLFSQVIQNLVSNAIKFCKNEDSITLKAPADKPATISVTDTGAGIEESRQDKLFRYEERTSTPGTSGEKGTGLGLPLSRDIMEAHGGTLEIESAVGRGSAFFARLPSVRPIILMVDDDQAVTLRLRKELEPLHAEILECGNGKEALDMMEETVPHLIILDITMPVMDGFEFLSIIRNSTSFKEIPVIILTVDEREDSSEKAFHLGANDLVSKKTERWDFIPRIRRYIS